jgi:hypothetical protein
MLVGQSRLASTSRTMAQDRSSAQGTKSTPTEHLGRLIGGLVTCLRIVSRECAKLNRPPTTPGTACVHHRQGDTHRLR